MPEAWIGVLSAAVAIALREGIAWVRNRRRDEAAAGLTLGQSWQAIVEELRRDVGDLRARVTSLEAERDQAHERAKALAAEVDRYRSIARSLLRHVLRLRDALAAQGVEAPPIPPEIEDAFTSLDLPG